MADRGRRKRRKLGQEAAALLPEQAGTSGALDRAYGSSASSKLRRRAARGDFAFNPLEERLIEVPASPTHCPTALPSPFPSPLELAATSTSDVGIHVLDELDGAVEQAGEGGVTVRYRARRDEETGRYENSVRPRLQLPQRSQLNAVCNRTSL